MTQKITIPYHEHLCHNMQWYMQRVRLHIIDTSPDNFDGMALVRDDINWKASGSKLMEARKQGNH